MFAKLKPVVPLKLGKAKRIADSESAAKDNTDVFRVKLKKGELIHADLTTKVTDALFSVTPLRPHGRALDLTNDVTKHILKDSGGLSPTPFVNKRVKSSGTYYIAVETPGHAAGRRRQHDADRPGLHADAEALQGAQEEEKEEVAAGY